MVSGSAGGGETVIARCCEQSRALRAFVARKVGGAPSGDQARPRTGQRLAGSATTATGCQVSQRTTCNTPPAPPLPPTLPAAASDVSARQSSDGASAIAGGDAAGGSGRSCTTTGILLQQN